MSTISVIIPVFNHARTLKAVLKSIAGQTTRASEIIVVDDGSTDHLSSRVHELQKEFSFNFLQQPNQGAASARNTGFRIAHGEFVIFWDADTIAEPHFLEKLLEALQKNPSAAYSYSQFKFGFKTMRSQAFNAEKLRRLNYIDTTALIRRSALQGLVGPFDESLKRFQDWDLWLTLLAQNKTGVFVPEVLFKKIVGGRVGMSKWLPKWFYPLFPNSKAVTQYAAARKKIVQKHHLPT